MQPGDRPRVVRLMAALQRGEGVPYFERKPTLDEMMADVAAQHAAALIEYKPTTTRDQTARFVDLWAKHRAYDWAAVISFIPVTSTPFMRRTVAYTPRC